MNATERLIWCRLRGRQLDGWKFRRQHPIGPYFIDFYCPSARLAVEIDGPDHDTETAEAHDERRQAWLESLGHRVLRISVHHIDRSLDDVIQWIYAELTEQEAKGFARKPHRPASPPTSPQAGKS